jgi:uncharacterized membrane protein
MLGESYGLVLSFAIAAMFWVGQFRLLNSPSSVTAGLIYLVLLQLFWIVFLPISTSLWIRIEARETVMIMGANLMLIAVSPAGLKAPAGRSADLGACQDGWEAGAVALFS